MGLFSWLFGTSSTVEKEPETPPAAEPFPVSPRPERFVVWIGTGSHRTGPVEWRRTETVFTSEDEAYDEAASAARQGNVLEVRVLGDEQPAPAPDSPILAGRVAEAPQVPQIQKAQKFTFNKGGRVKFESGDTVEEYRYTIDGEELWILWEFAGRVSDQVYRFTPEGFNIHRAMERGAAEWYVFTDLGPNHIYTYTN
jgi:hypothetical protein